MDYSWWEDFLDGVLLEWQIHAGKPSIYYCSDGIQKVLGLEKNSVVENNKILYSIIPLSFFLPIDEEGIWSWKGLVETSLGQVPVHFQSKKCGKGYVGFIRKLDFSWSNTEDAERLKSVLSSVSNYQFFGIDNQFRLTFFSRNYGAKIRSIYYQYPKIGESIYDYIMISMQPRFAQLFEKAFLGETIQKEIEMGIEPREFCLLNLSPIFAESGLVREVLGVIEEKHETETLPSLPNRDFLKTILQNINDIIWSNALDLEQHTLFVSDNITRVFGYTPDEIYNKTNPWLQNVHPEDLPKVENSRTSVFEKGFSEVTYRMSDKAGTYHVVQDRLWVARDYQDRPIRIDGITSDITERSQIAEAKLRMESIVSGITKASPDIIYIYDIKLQKNVYNNHKLTEFLGYTVEEIDRNGDAFLLEIIHPDDRKIVQAIAEERARSQEDKIYEFTYRMLTKLGHYVWLESKEVVFQRDSENYPVQILGFARDITERKESEEKISLSERQMKFAQELAHLGSWELDLETNVISWSDEVFRIFDMENSLSEVHLNTIKGIFPLDFANAFLEQIEITMEYGIVQKSEIKIGQEGINIQYIISAMHPFKDHTGKTVKIYGSFLDITPLKTMQEELIFAKNRAEEAARAKSQFLSTMSHEIRTPLNGVIGMTNLLLEESKDPSIREHLDILKFSGETLLSLVNDILDLNKIDSGNVQIENLEFNLNFLASNIISLYQTKAKEKNIELNLMVEGLLPQIIGDPYRLTQILGNLVSNAIKFTQDGKVELKIGVLRQSEKELTIIFEVVDTGIGIPKEKQKQVFDLFIQAESHTSRMYGGTGLGLAIVKKLVELMKSEIQLESEQGRGSRFFFEVSFAKGESILEIVETKITNLKTGSMEGKRVLLVEDNNINVSVASRFLKKWGLVVDVAENGKVALEKIAKSDYDLILMDLQMPVMDGFEATKNIRAVDKHRNLPIIALSADALRETKEKVFRYSMNDYILKPFNPDVVKEKIMEHIL
jgi:PAS domain S-box-containing protein